MRRKVTEELLRWKESGRRTCPVVKGPRQVGKTYAVSEFGRKHFPNFVYFDLSTDELARAAFSGSLTVDSIIVALSAISDKDRFVPYETLIFLDEIQDCPRARTALKPFAVDGRYKVIASGSLLGLRRSEVPSYPVGYEEVIEMHPMDFEEFLWAVGLSDRVISYVRDCISGMVPMDESVLESMYRYMRWYMIVGGMPGIVSGFAETKRFDIVRRGLKDLLRDYKDDIGSYADDDQKDKVERCFDSIASQLSRDNKTFVYSAVGGNPAYSVGSRYFGYALNWLIQAHLSIPCDCVTQPRLPLEQNASNPRFKLFLLDTGLLMSMYDESIPHGILRGDIEVNQGALCENLVACMLHSQGRRLFYFQESEPGRERMELDFVTTVNGRATAIEVKSGKKRDSRSLNKCMRRFGAEGIMFGTGNIFTDDKGVRHYPLFAAAFMDSIDPPADVEVDLPDAEELNRRFGE